MGTANKLLQAASGGAGDSVYVEDVFSTFLYTGTGATLAIDNGLDLDGEGGLVWLKGRGAMQHRLFDTERGANKYITSQDSAGEVTKTDNLMSFNSNGFTLGADSSTSINGDGSEYVSWSWRKQPGFFDVVKWTGTGGNLTLSHNLGCIPGMILIKNCDGTHDWKVYHVGTDASTPQNKYLVLNGQNAAANAGNAYFQQTAPTATNFYVGSNADTNESGQTMIAYLFAAGTDSDSQIFGDDGDEACIKCGSYTGGTDGTTFVDLGFEPQWVLLKKNNGSSNWAILDFMRGFNQNQGDTPPGRLEANSYGAENTSGMNGAYSAPTGFYPWGNSGGDWNANGSPYIYVAIRKEMKAPDYGTEVFAATTGSSSGAFTHSTNFRVDFNITTNTTSGSNRYFSDRPRGSERLFSDTTDTEASLAINWDRMTGWQHTSTGDYSAWTGWNFKRAPKFLDVLAWTGDGASSRNISHNLGVAPELMIVKSRSSAYDWHTFVAALGNDKELRLNSTTAALSFAYWGNTTPTSTVFTVSDTGGVGIVNGSGKTYIGYLFATLAGVSKVGSYTGTASPINIDCGFSSSARFVLIKRTDSAGAWYLYDSHRGISTSSDPYITLNTNGAQSTVNDIEPYSSGFTVRSGGFNNSSGGEYIFLAIA